MLLQYEPWHWAKGGLSGSLAESLRKVRSINPAVELGVFLHEIDLYPVKRLRDHFLSIARRRQLRRITSSCDTVFSPVDDWRRHTSNRAAFVSLPVGSNLPTEVEHNGNHQTSRDASPRPVTLGLFGRIHGANVESVERILEAWPQAAPELRLRHFGSPRSVPEAIGGTAVEASGYLPAEELADQLSQCDALVACFPEGATLRRSSLLGALALGVPCVTNTGPWTNAAFYEDAEGGLLFLGPKNAAEVAEALAVAGLRPAQFAARREEAKAFYQQHCSWEVVIERVREALGLTPPVQAAHVETIGV